MHQKYKDITLNNLEKEIDININLKYIKCLMKLLEMYMPYKENFSAHEFCTMILIDKNINNNFKENSKLSSYILKCVQALDAKSINTMAHLFLELTRFQLLLKTITEEYFKRTGFHKRKDLFTIIVLTYILICQTSKLTNEDAQNCLKYFHVYKVLPLVSFLLLPSTFKFLSTKASEIFDESFVEEKILNPFKDNISILKDIENIYLKIQDLKKPRKKITKPIIMNVLNHPKSIPSVPPPTPEKITKMPIKKIPNSTYVQPKTEKKLGFLRCEDKLRTVQLLNNANKSVPCYFGKRKPVKNIICDEKNFRKIIKKSLPNFQQQVKVKETSASILRKCACIINEELKEIKKLKSLSEGGFDENMVHILKQEEKVKQMEKEMIRIQEKHLSMLLIREKAFLAKKHFLKGVKDHADVVRKEAQELCQKLQKWKEEINKENLLRVEKCHSLSKASRDSYNSMLNNKRQEANKVLQESQKLKLILEKQKQEEMRKKMLLIKEIKAIKNFEPSSTKDYHSSGLLCEMSLEELKTKLNKLKIDLKDEVKNRKSLIQQERERHKNLIEQSKKKIESYQTQRWIESLMSESDKQIVGISKTIVKNTKIKELEENLEKYKSLRMK